MSLRVRTASDRLARVSAHLSSPGPDPPPPRDSSRPSEAAAPAKAASPPVVVLFGGANIPPAHYRHYAARYATLDPSVRLFVLDAGFTEFTPRPFSSLRHRRRGFDKILEALGIDPSPALHAHVFSNAGTARLGRLAEYHQQRRGTPLPVTTLIFDSGPSPKGPWANAIVTVAVLRLRGAWRLVGFGAALLWTSCVWALAALTGEGDFVASALRFIDDPAFLRPEAPRLYVFSRADPLMDWRAVEARADAARRKGCKVRELEVEGSGHVQHARMHPDQYWVAVADLWREAASRNSPGGQRNEDM